MSVDDGRIDVARHEATCVLTIDASARLNALSTGMRLALRERLREAHRDESVRSIVLTGAGQAFSAGGDIRQMADPASPSVSRERLEVLHDVVRLIVDGPKPVVAAVEGIAYGAGFSLAAACDHVIASRSAAFSAAFGKLGLVADCGLFWTLPQRTGIGPARDLLMTGRRFDAAEAERLGIVDRLVEEGSALARAIEKTREYEAIGPLAIAATKSAFARRPPSLQEALHLEADLQAFLRQSEDHRSACAAFLGKRPVQFTGR